MHDPPSSISCLFTGGEIAGYSEAQLSGIRKETVGFIFRSFNLIGELAVSENAGLVRLHYKIGREERRMRVAAVMIPPIVCLTFTNLAAARAPARGRCARWSAPRRRMWCSRWCGIFPSRF